MSFARYCNFKKLVTKKKLLYFYTDWLFLFVGICNESETQERIWTFCCKPENRQIRNNGNNKSRGQDLTKGRGQYTMHYVVKQ